MILEEETIDLSTPTGPMRTYVVRPRGEQRLPGLVFYTEIFQRTAPMARMAAMFAGHGFVVAMPEIWHELEPAGRVLPYEESERGNRHKTEKTIRAFDDDASAAVSYLAAHPRCNGKIGAVGTCIGGHLAVRTAMNPAVGAAISFYGTDFTGKLGSGTGADTLDRLGEIRGELLMVWGRQDPHIAAEARARVYERMQSAGVSMTWHEFNAAHAFLRDEGPRYDPELAALCYRLAIETLRRRLG